MANTISDELNRLIQAKAGIKSALEEKGLTIGDSSTLDEYPGLILEMEVGGGDTSTLINLMERDILNLDIPEGTTKIGNNIFSGCHLLRNITIPNTVGLIGAGAFNYCELLNNLIIPNSVGAIGPKTFYQNTNLNDLVILRNTPPTLDSENVFNNSLKIYVKNAAINSYKNAGGNWNDISTKIEPLAAIDYDASTYTVTALGRDNLELYVDSSLIDSSVYTFTPGTEDSSHVITVKSVDPSLGILDEVSLEILIEGEIDYTRLYFGLTSILDASVGLTSTKDGGVDMKYSSDGQNWSTWDYANETLNLPAGETLYFKGDNSTGLATTGTNLTNFLLNTGKVKAHGNILSLMYSDSFVNNNILPAFCYCQLFLNCTSLTEAPELPATTLGNYCYYNMFKGCTSLTKAPEQLPATTLANLCNYGMFYGCTSLTEAPELPATTLVESCYQYMFYGCTSLTEAPELPATTLKSSCYAYMFLGCTSLTEAPELPATTLIRNCYEYMFKNCNSLNYIKAMFTTAPSTSYTSGWVSNVSATGTFVMNSATTWDLENYRNVGGIPEGWTVEKVTA